MKMIKNSTSKMKTILMVVLLCLGTLSGWAQQYNAGDVAVINAMIDNNGLKWTKADPADGSYVPSDWASVSWMYWSNNSRIYSLYVNGESLTGALDLSGLAELQTLDCSNNSLTSLNVSGLSNLNSLDCSNNTLTVLNLSGGLYNLQTLDCSNNSLSSLDLTDVGMYYSPEMGGMYPNCSGQKVYLNMTENGAGAFSTDVTLNSPYFGTGGLAYDNAGTLTSNGVWIRSSSFSVQIDNQSGWWWYSMDGMLYMTYPGQSTGTFNTGDIAIINAIISNNNLNWPLADPIDGTYIPDWPGITWSNVENNKRITGLDISSKSLTGTLNLFGLTELQTLNCSNNSLTDMILSGLTKLQTLSCNNNNLTTLNLTEFTNLQTLNCSTNNLSVLNLSGLTNLQTLNCTSTVASPNLTGLSGLQTLTCGGSTLTTLNVSGVGLSGLQTLSCTSSSLTSLSLTGLPALSSIACNSNSNLTSLSLSGLPVLSSISCYYNSNLTSLSLSGFPALQTINCSYNKLTSLYLSELPKVQTLSCNNNSLTSLNVSNLTTLQTLNISGNSNLVFPNLSGLTVLQTLDCGSTGLTSLNVSEFTTLRSLICRNNSLTSLDVSALTALYSLNCSSNKLTLLNLSGLSALQTLDYSNNSLASLDVSALTALYDLNCSNNGLNSLDVSNLTGLQSLDCSNNNLTSLSLLELSNLYSLNASNNRLTALTLPESDYYQTNLNPWSVYLSGQQVNLTLTGSDNNYTANVMFRVNGDDYTYSYPPQFYGSGWSYYNSPLSYSEGVLKSTDPNVTSANFSIQIDISNYMYGYYGSVSLDGTLNLTYQAPGSTLPLDSAKVLIESETYTVSDLVANTETDVKTWLVDRINSIIVSTGVTVEESDITISNFTAALSGTTNGSFAFVVSLRDGGISENTSLIAGKITTSVYTDVDPQEYENRMSFTTAIILDGVEVTSGNWEICAFSGTEEACRGSIVMQDYQDVPVHPYLGIFNVYGNGGEKIEFKVYNHDRDTSYIATNSIIFDTNHYGNYDSPYEVTIANAVEIAPVMTEQEIELAEGWGWISSNVTNNEISLLEQFKQQAQNATLLRGPEGVIQAPYWHGTFSAINNTDMYEIEASDVCTISFTGLPVDPAATPITLLKGWNWIGYMPQGSLPIDEALANLNPQDGDQIKSRAGFIAYYAEGGGWLGELSTMNPGEGYKYYSTNATNQTLVYPSELTPQLRSSNNKEALSLRWTAQSSRFANNMTLTAIVSLGNEELQSDQIEIGAFCGDECRGSVLLKNIPQLTKHPYMGFLVVYGENNETIRLRVFNHETGQEYEAGNVSLSFVSDAIQGSPSAPFRITLLSPTGVSEVQSGAVYVYTDAAGEKLYIQYPWNSIDRLEIVDLNGRRVIQKTNFVSEFVQISSLAQGIYILKVVKDNQVSVYKFKK